MAKLEIPVIVKCTEIDELIDEIKHLQTYKLFEVDEQVLIDRDDTIEIFAKHIRASVQPEQKVGKWIIKYDSSSGWYRVTCSECGEDVTSEIRLIGFIPNYKALWDYCPYCGKKMEEQDANGT